MKLIVPLIALAPLVLSCEKHHGTAYSDAILVTVKRDYERPALEEATIVLDWHQVTAHLPQLESMGYRVTDQHFGNALDSRLLDTDGDDQPDRLQVTYAFSSAEPQYVLMIAADPEGTLSVETGTAEPDPRFELTYLKSYAAYSNGDSVASWPQKIFESSLNFYPDVRDFTIISPGEWTYEHGMFLNAGFELWQRTNNTRYLTYMKEWLDLFLTEEGRIKDSEYNADEYRLDDILPGRLCIYLFEETGDQRYKTAADQLIDHLKHQPRTSEGGYWHKQIYPYQMWLDGIYMADIFSMQYAQAFHEPEWFDEAVKQVKLISTHAKDSVTGLMYHGWDESKNPVWANPVTGASPAFWGRAIGWYFMALVDCLDYLPEDHADRAELVRIFRDLALSVAGYQDKESKLWFQVIDKGDHPGNWVETSCSAMFTYGFAKGYNKGLLDESFHQRAREAFEALIRDYTWYDDNGNLYLDQTVKVGTLNLKVSRGDFDYYIGGERRINDYKGLGALLYAGLALSETPMNPELAKTREERE
jgi:unsaturated rhamnogalacturonyl hydrolase